MSDSVVANHRRLDLKAGPWLFSPAVDLWAFAGSAVVALGLLAVGWQQGWLESDTPEWLWITAILMVDVAHVYSTGFRVYFDRNELKRRPWLYTLAPLLSLILGMAVYSEGHVLFWRCLAYLAVFHFVRQQYGWVALYRARAEEEGKLDRWIDTVTIYIATLYPLAYWHAHLPRSFTWFLEGDFVAVPQFLSAVLAPIYWGSLAAYASRAACRYLILARPNPGKDIVVGTTVICWYVGIVAINSNYAFTVTNVIIHGVPYMVLVYWYRWCRKPDRLDDEGTKQPSAWGLHASRIAAFLGLVWMLAYFEELLWDAGVWHERPWLFGTNLNIGRWEGLLVPLLAVPQLTHYVLDGFIWRRRSNREVSEFVSETQRDSGTAGSNTIS